MTSTGPLPRPLKCCPSCKSVEIYHRKYTYTKNTTHGPNGYTRSQRYVCSRCGNKFDVPAMTMKQTAFKQLPKCFIASIKKRNAKREATEIQI